MSFDYDLLCFRFSSATNRLITSKDHASVQINVGHLDDNGIYTGQFSTFALCGFIRAQVIVIYLSVSVVGFVAIGCGLICSCIRVLNWNRTCLGDANKNLILFMPIWLVFCIVLHFCVEVLFKMS